MVLLIFNTIPWMYFLSRLLLLVSDYDLSMTGEIRLASSLSRLRRSEEGKSAYLLFLYVQSNGMRITGNILAGVM